MVTVIAPRTVNAENIAVRRTESDMQYIPLLFNTFCKAVFPTDSIGYTYIINLYHHGIVDPQ